TAGNLRVSLRRCGMVISPLSRGSTGLLARPVISSTFSQPLPIAAQAFAPWAMPGQTPALHMASALAEFERDLIRTRTGEGRARAVARGVRLGRKPKLTAHQQQEALRRREAGEPLTEIARTYNVSHSTISRLPSPDFRRPRQR